MGIKLLIEKVPRLKSAILKVTEGCFCLLTIVSPELNTKARYFAGFHKKLNLKEPKTLNQKILWLKLKRYMNDPLVVQCADKFRVREYVKQCGCEDILIELYGVYDSVEEIDWEALPNEFVLKWNFGAGYNIICTNKAELDKDETLRIMKEWGKSRYWLTHSEMQYKKMQKKIICERLLKTEE